MTSFIVCGLYRLSEAPHLSFSSLSFERDDTPVFSGVSGELWPGDMLQVEGPNGCGKTTLLRILATSLTPTEGGIVWQQQPLRKVRQDYLNDLLFIGHQPAVKQGLSALENLRFWRVITPCKDTMSDSEALAKMGLYGYEDIPCFSLSAGQLRRVALTRLLISCATIWLLDEPFTAIDKQGVADISALLNEHVEQGGIVVVSTHQDLGLNKVKHLDLSVAAETLAVVQ